MDEILASIRKIIENNEAQPDLAADADEDEGFAITTESHASLMDHPAVVDRFHSEEEQRTVVQPFQRSEPGQGSQPALSLAAVAARVRAASERHVAATREQAEPAAIEPEPVREESPLVAAGLTEASRPVSAEKVEPVMEETVTIEPVLAIAEPAAPSRDIAALVSPAVGERVAQSFGALAEAIATLERDGEFHSPKLITEAALAFAGEATELEAELKERVGRVSPHTVAALVNYLRMAGLGDPDVILALMRDEREDLEVRLACIRYFMRRHWPAAEADLLKLASDNDPARWEYRAIAATALSNYPGMEAVEALKGCLSNPSWFVRNNAAKTLYDYGLALDDLADVMNGPDAYARDMLAYHWELKRVEEEERKRKEALPA